MHKNFTVDNWGVQTGVQNNTKKLKMFHPVFANKGIWPTFCNLKRCQITFPRINITWEWTMRMPNLSCLDNNHVNPCGQCKIRDSKCGSE